jgi:hypothetical protein
VVVVAVAPDPDMVEVVVVEPVGLYIKQLKYYQENMKYWLVKED